MFTAKSEFDLNISMCSLISCIQKKQITEYFYSFDNIRPARTHIVRDLGKHLDNKLKDVHVNHIT